MVRHGGVKIRRMRFGISAYSFAFGCGFVQREGRRAATPMNAFGLAALASEWGLASIETPLGGMLPELSTGMIDRLRETLKAAHLGLVVDASVVEVGMLQALLPVAARAGARVVRAIPSALLEGARATLAGGWEAYFQELKERIVAIRPLLEAYDLVLAIENHQDATSDDLLELCAAGEPYVGITLDVANPLAVGEEPLQFARKVGPWVRNVHLKDYRIFTTPSGFRLVRCALGEGVIPFEELFPLLRDVAPNATQHIELAALYARHIRLLEDDWWQGYPPRDVREVVPVLRLAAQQARPAGESWETPWELGASPEEVGQYERDQFEMSVRYLQGVGYVELST